MSLLTVIFPCHNEALNLPELYRQLVESFTPAFSGGGRSLDELEILFVDDGSNDETFNVALSLTTDPRVRAISFSRNFGKEAAMLAGLEHARGDAVVIMDSDLQHPPSLLRELMQGYLEGYHQVIAIRNRDGDSKLRTWLSRRYYWLAAKIINVPLEDGAGDFRLLSREAVNALLKMREYNRFSKGLFAWLGMATKKVYYNNTLRIDGKSSWTYKSLFNYGLDGITAFNDRPLRFVINIGLISFLVFIAYLLFLVINVLVTGIDVPGYVTTIAIIVGMGGVQLASIGILGEYVSKIYSEVKRRPHYIIENDSWTQNGATTHE